MQEKTIPEKKQQPGTGIPMPESNPQGGQLPHTGGQTDVGKKGGEVTQPGVKKGKDRPPGV